MPYSFLLFYSVLVAFLYAYAKICLPPTSSKLLTLLNSRLQYLREGDWKGSLLSPFLFCVFVLWVASLQQYQLHSWKWAGRFRLSLLRGDIYSRCLEAAVIVLRTIRSGFVTNVGSKPGLKGRYRLGEDCMLPLRWLKGLLHILLQLWRKKGRERGILQNGGDMPRRALKRIPQKGRGKLRRKNRPQRMMYMINMRLRTS